MTSAIDWTIVAGFAQVAAIAITGGLAVYIGRQQVGALVQQLRSSDDTERLRASLSYIEHFRSGKYQISKSPIVGEMLEATPSYAFSVCQNLLLDEEAFEYLITRRENESLRSLVIGLASVAYNFCAQTAVLIWKGHLDEGILLDLLWGEIITVDKALRRLGDVIPELQDRLDTIPYRLIVALSKKRSVLTEQRASSGTE